MIEETIIDSTDIKSKISNNPPYLYYDGENYYFRVKTNWAEKFLPNTIKIIKRKLKLEKLLK